MKIKKITLSENKTNCYIVFENSIAFIIDPASDGKIIEDYLRKNELQLADIFLTHGHQDHIGAVDYLYSIYNCKIHGHYLDKDLFEASDPTKLINLPSFKGIKINSPISYFGSDFYSFEVDGITIDAILTPGHTEGSVTYVLRNYLRVFSGDTLFKGNIGRVDFPTSSPEKMKKSLEIYKTLVPDCKIYPGHGESTSLQEELISNPYLLDKESI